MNSQILWHPFDEGSTLDTHGSENGIIIKDEANVEQDVRITLEHDSPTAPFAITCGIQGWMVHTRFFSILMEAEQAFEEMKRGLADIYEIIPYRNDPEAESKYDLVAIMLKAFIVRFP